MNLRIRNYDVVRFVGVLLVICIHSLMPLRESLSVGELTLNHWIYAVYDSLVNAGVPLFIMLSGALLLGRQESMLDFYKKRLSRLLIPFLLWSILVYAMSCVLQPWQGLGSCLQLFVVQLTTTGVNRAYWFVYMLLGLYLITPLLQYVLRRVPKPAMYVILILLFCLYRVPKLPFVWYYLMGYILTQNIRLPKWLAVSGLGLSFLLQVLTTVYSWYPLPWPMLIGVCLFALLTNDAVVSDNADAITFVSTNSYGIYLSHVIFCGILLRLSVYTSHIPLWLLPLATTIIVFSIEYLLMLVLTRLHLDKYLC